MPSLKDLWYIIMRLHTTNTTPEKSKHRHHYLPQPLVSRGFTFIGECDHCMLHNQSQSMQHGNVIFDETNIFFILLTIILQVLDQHAHELKVSYFSDDLLFFLAVASKRRALTVSTCGYFNCRCPPSHHHVWHDFRWGGHGAIVTVLSRTHRYNVR